MDSNLQVFYKIAFSTGVVVCFVPETRIGKTRFFPIFKDFLKKTYTDSEDN